MDTHDQAEWLARTLEALELTVFVTRSRSTTSVYIDAYHYEPGDELGEKEPLHEWSIRVSNHPPRPNFRGRYPKYDFEIGPYPEATPKWRDALDGIREELKGGG